ncbi:cytochrome c biogenesis protein CcsA [Alteromonadaceae bacterium BrNp21-10]|nr:cytochrome c biogenesis protein CcsA [Alteromonadaceae bacterium BrNp21-10]
MQWISLVVILLYVIAASAISARLFHHQGPQPRWSTLTGTIALIAHFVLLNQSIFAAPDQNMSMTNVASLIAWLISLSMTVASFSLSSALLLPMVYGFSALVVLINWLLPSVHMMHLQYQPALISHITIALVAYGCLIIAFLYALQLSYINYRLKRKQASMLHSSLPPLMRVEAVLIKLLLVGTILLLMSLVSGFVFLDNMFADGQAHKTILSCIAWVIYVATLIGHYQFGWRGKLIIVNASIGAILLTLAYFGSRFVKEVILGHI